MIDFIQSLSSNYNDITKMIMFNFLKTGNPLYDAVISTFAVSLFGFVLNYLYEYGLQNVFNHLSFDHIKSCFYRKNMIVIEGKKSSVTSIYTSIPSVSSFS